jgi:N-methylhydantoinase B/oxoprolinase/acetone carboxylase alpha subunit
MGCRSFKGGGARRQIEGAEAVHDKEEPWGIGAVRVPERGLGVMVRKDDGGDGGWRAGARSRGRPELKQGERERERVEGSKP